MSDWQQFQPLAEHALALVPDGAVIGLGTGHAASAFLRVLGERVRHGFKVRGVPTSEASAALAREVGIPLTTLDDVESLDLCIDGADEVDPSLNLIKGYGGALVREKIVASSARKLIILVGDEKLVSVLGSRGRLPVEVIPFAQTLCKRKLTSLRLNPQERMGEGKRFITDNGNVILDCRTKAILNPVELDEAIRAIPGVVGTGLFLRMTPTVFVQTGTSVSQFPG